jgi:uncharacterized protein CbrC (UPF0167 family)
MKKLKATLMALAIFLGVGGAIASTQSLPNCANMTQYYYTGSGYAPAGIEGYDYVCSWDHFSSCTYYYDTQAKGYRTCKYGRILWIR